MKKLILGAFLLLFVASVNAQTEVELKINHKLGVEDFILDAVGTNDLGHEFKATRLEYYVTRITIVHDGGTETAVSDEVVALVRPEDEISTSIDLGSFDVTSIESVKFHIGVYEPINNDDPSLFDAVHPLAPKSPSMHWGWAAGYRFIAYEGFGGVDFSQNFQLHGLGNSNYFEVESDVWVETVGDVLVMSLNGDYAAGLNEIDLTAGTISHGTTGAAKKVLENWRDIVFGLYTVGVNEEIAELNWSIYPNPSNGDIVVNFENTTEINQVNIINPLGEIVQTSLVNDSKQMELSIPDSGIYFVSVLNAKGETIATERLIIK
ncbi:MAG: hypothetical protein ACI8ZM_004647 [Crocinitomix sp.]|jgi:hypothetical protein